MFNIQNNKLIRDLLGAFPDEKDFGQNDPATNVEIQSASQKLAVLRTYADGSAAAVQRIAPNLLAGIDESLLMPPRSLSVTNNPLVDFDPNQLSNISRFGQSNNNSITKEALLAKVQALGANPLQERLLDEGTSGDFTKVYGLTINVLSSKIKTDAKKEVAIALKPFLERLKTNYDQELQALINVMPESERKTASGLKISDIERNLSGNQIQFIEKSQRQSQIMEALLELEKIIGTN